LNGIDGILFDCDGTLVDVRASYDLCIIETGKRLFSELTGKQADERDIERIVSVLRRTGYFNNDWDSAFGSILLLFVSDALLNGKKAVELAAAFSERGGDVFRLIEFARSFQVDGLSELLDYLAYPGTPPHSRLASLFDALYYGKNIYREMYGEEAPVNARGMITNERVLVDASFLQWVFAHLGRRPALITGRTFRAAQITLGELLNFFDMEASTFIEDEEKRGERRYSKPSALAAEKAIRHMGAGRCLFAGDSAEDLMLVKNARSKGLDIEFVGVTGHTLNGESVEEFFRKEGVAVVRDVNELRELI